MSKARFTDRTHRSADGHWVKITRDSVKREFALALGRSNEVQATRVLVVPFSFMPTWADAEERARDYLANPTY